MLALALLILLNLWILKQTTEPREFTDVKERYRVLRNHLKETENEKFHMLTRWIPLTGMRRMNGSVGSNTNKGGEIIICLDGAPNEIFHVLIHELAHCTVEEYSHSPAFWANYIELRDICISLGIYKQIHERTAFCGQHVQDK
jgi:hypothetical protein